LHQFIHIEVYAEFVSAKAMSRRTKVNKNGKQNFSTKSLLNIRNVIAEAKREHGAHPHVPYPQTPINLYGVDLDEVERLAIASKVGQYDSRSRKLRIDTPILLAGVASYPQAEYVSNKADFDSWLINTVNWLKGMYGDNLKNITQHLDEEHPHIHFYAISPSGRVKQIHHGYIAENLVDVNDKNARKLAYKDGMRKFQDSYFSEVALKHGMLRIGPRRQRKSRAEHNADKSNANLIARKIKDVDLIVQHAIKDTKYKSDLILKSAELNAQELLFKARNEVKLMNDKALQWNKNTIENMRKLDEAEAKVKRLDAQLKTTISELEYFVNENRELERKLLDIRPNNHSNNY
jgi:hypothetical protein